MIKQLTLGVSLKDDATFENFNNVKNNLIVEELKKSACGIGEKLLFLYGNGGEGATHLLQASCHLAHHQQLNAAYIPMNQLKEFTPAIFEALESQDLICLDDIHKIAGLKEWEEAFFHTYNRIHDAGKRLILSSKVLPKLIQTLPDIVSRLSSGIVYQLNYLTDDEKIQTMIMRADRRGMTLTEEVSKFILKNCPRHMTTLFAALDVLDKASLAAQRKLTIPFVKTILQI